MTINLSDPNIKAPFNMALNTLERIGEILREIRKLDQDFLLNRHQKQPIKVSLVKSLFSQASPLLPDEIVEQYREKVVALRANEGHKAKVNAGIVKIGNATAIFNQELEDKLDNLIIDIQKELQREKYFMPPKRDLGSVVSDF